MINGSSDLLENKNGENNETKTIIKEMRSENEDEGSTNPLRY